MSDLFNLWATDDCLRQLQTELLRLRLGDVLVRTNESLKVGINDVDRTIQIGELAIMAGCDVKFNELVEPDPPLYGMKFTRRSDVPIFEGIDSAGSA